MHAPKGMSPFGAIEWLNLEFIVARWLKGFHAALYGEFLSTVNGAIHAPFPGGETPGEDTTLHVLPRIDGEPEGFLGVAILTACG